MTLDEALREIEEQARLLGMSAEREAKLLAENERLEQENECVANNHIACTETLRKERKEFRAEIERLKSIIAEWNSEA